MIYGGHITSEEKPITVCVELGCISHNIIVTEVVYTPSLMSSADGNPAGVGIGEADSC